MNATSSSEAASTLPAPALAVARLASLLAAVVAGFAAVAAGLVAQVPAPTTLWRAVAVAAGTRVVAGWIAAALAASLKDAPRKTVKPAKDEH
jgi:hypothetical protein